jgi:hypothetical protein
MREVSFFKDQTFFSMSSIAQICVGQKPLQRGVVSMGKVINERKYNCYAGV